MDSQNIEYKQVRKDDYLKWTCCFSNNQGDSAKEVIRLVDAHNNTHGHPDPNTIFWFGSVANWIIERTNLFETINMGL
jgi:hypothetical protein